MQDDKCVTKYCRGEVVVKHVGNLYCQECYNKFCEGVLK